MQSVLIFDPRRSAGELRAIVEGAWESWRAVREQMFLEPHAHEISAHGVTARCSSTRSCPAAIVSSPLALLDGVLAPAEKSGTELRSGLYTSSMDLRMIKQTLRAPDGNYALVVADPVAVTVTMAIDLIGSKTVYLYCRGSTLILSSNLILIQAVLNRLHVPLTLSHDALYRYYDFGVIPSPLTIYREIERARPGEVVTFSGSDGEWRRQVVLQWDYDFNRVSTDPESTLSTNLRHRLWSATGRLLPKEGPIGVGISGGIDSTICLGLAREHRPEGVLHTFCVGYQSMGGAADEDRAHARKVSSLYGTTHHELDVGPSAVNKALGATLLADAQPSSADLNEYFLSEICADVGCVELLAGEGADSMFAGTSHFELLAQIQRFKKIPYFLRAAVDRMTRFLPEMATVLGKHPLLVFRRFQDAAEGTAGDRYLRVCHHYFAEGAAAHLFQGLSVERASSADFLNQEIIRSHAFRDPIEETLFLLQRFECPNTYLRTAHKEAFGGTVFSPYVFRSIAEYAASIPWNLKYRPGAQKYILVDACRDLLPDFVLTRPKRGFSLPFSRWICRAHREGISEFLSRPNAKLLEFVEREAFTTLLRRFVATEGEWQRHRVWALFCLELWLELVANRPVSSLSQVRSARFQDFLPGRLEGELTSVRNIS